MPGRPPALLKRESPYDKGPRRARLAVAIAAGQAAALACMALRRGGTSLPGLVSLRIEPHVVRLLGSQLGGGNVVVAGTNGKTTTSSWIAAAFAAGGKTALHNRAGSNMMRGIATTLVRRSWLNGRLRGARRRTGVFEVDEAALPAVVGELQPRLVMLTNLFRDQLDRYGEIATTAEKWRQALGCLPGSTTLLLNADDPLVASLASAATGTVLYYGVASWHADAARTATQPPLSADSLYCPRCATSLRFAVIAYAHLGRYSCPSCGYARPDPDFDACVTAADGESSVIEIAWRGQHALCRVALPGRYNVYNALAAVATATAAGVAFEIAARTVSGAPGAFGRAETMHVDGHAVRLYLIKNPTGADEVFRVVAQGDRAATLLLLLSDNAADGEDVSWIWDAQLELLLPWSGAVICGGTRAEDMALRMKYAGYSESVTTVPQDVGAAVRTAVESAPAGGPVVVLATYTAMLAARSVLARGGHVKQYWQARS